MRPRLLGLALGAALAAPAASARDCAYYGVNGPGVYQLQNGLDEAYAAHIDAARLGATRLGFRIDTETSWDDALFARYDDYVARARAHGYAILGIVLYESTTLGQVDWNDDPDGDGWNAYGQLFVDTARRLLERYGDRIKDWEIWNEPNCWSNPDYRNDPQHAGCYYILPRVYAKLLAETFVQAHSTLTAQELHLVAGGLLAHDIGGGFSPATDYMSEVYDQGPWDWLQASYGRRYPWDAFGYHVYIDQGGPTFAAHLGRYLDAIQSLKASRGDGTPLWLTEFGWSTNHVSEAVQAQNLGTALGVFESRSDIERTFVFKLDDYDGWGLYRADWSAKPARQAVLDHDGTCQAAPPPPDAGADGGPQGGGAPPDAPSAGDGPAPGADGGRGCAVGAARPGPGRGALVFLGLLLAAARAVDNRKPRR